MPADSVAVLLEQLGALRRERAEAQSSADTAPGDSAEAHWREVLWEIDSKIGDLERRIARQQSQAGTLPAQAPPHEKPAVEAPPSPPVHRASNGDGAEQPVRLNDQDTEIPKAPQAAADPSVNARDVTDEIREEARRRHRGKRGGAGRRRGNDHHAQATAPHQARSRRPPPTIDQSIPPPTEAPSAPQSTEGPGSAPEKPSLAAFDMTPRGLFHGPTGSAKRRMLCNYFEVVGDAVHENGLNPGLVIRIPGTARPVLIPRAWLFGDGRLACERLATYGLGYICPDRQGRELIIRYLSLVAPLHAYTALLHGGWHRIGSAAPGFLLGYERYGGTAPVILSGELGEPELPWQPNSKLEDWRQRVAAPCVGNSRLILALCTAFAAPLLWITGGDRARGLLLNLIGDTSTGKTTAQSVAASVWGDPGRYIYSWQSTVASLEPLAALHSDTLMVIDDLSTADARDLRTAIYMLANGLGKSRATTDMRLRAAYTWRAVVLSSGETSAREMLEEALIGARAGLDMRLVNIPADAGQDMGVVEALHGFASPEALIRSLSAAAGEFYGTPARAWLTRLTRRAAHDFGGLRAEIARYIAQCREDWTAQAQAAGFDMAHASGQVAYIMDMLGLVAAGGWLAVRVGLLSWDEREPAWGIGRCFLDWLQMRGTTQPGDLVEGLRRMARLIEAHGMERFDLSSAEADGATPRSRSRNRLGYRELTFEGQWQYFVLPEAWRTEFARGLDPRRLARAAVAAGWLIPGDGKNLTQKRSVPAEGCRLRVYVLRQPEQPEE